MSFLRTKIAPVFLIGLSVAVVILSVLLLVTEQERDALRADIGAIQSSVRNNAVAPGRACGVLDQREVTQLLGVSGLNRQYSNVPASLSGKSNGLDNGAIDSCQYTDPSSSLTYADLFINVYDTNEEAERLFDEKLPVGVELEELDTSRYPYVQKLVYSDGVLYVLAGREFISVGAGNGDQTQTRDLVLRIFDNIIEELYP